MAKSRKPDTAESNAGNDVHVLWTIRKCLELLNFSKDGLKVVSIEGLTCADEKILTSDGDILLGVDLTEYYGGDSFITADVLQNLTELSVFNLENILSLFSFV